MLILNLLFPIIGGVIGYFVLPNLTGILIGLGGGIILGLITWMIEKVSLNTLLAGLKGVFAGFILGLIFYLSFQKWIGNYFWLIILLASYTGLVVGVKKSKESFEGKFSSLKKYESGAKIIDTSVLIDGRIFEISELGFLEGIFYVPHFILKELQNIADSTDNLKRQKGRRGLDVLKKLEDSKNIDIKIINNDYPEIPEVDTKIIKLAIDLKAGIVTVDYNLNKIASLQDIKVLNINALANALKPILLPGEVVKIFVIKEGKERKQGIGYLEDGTMVVVEDGRQYIGKEIEVEVDSILQTDAGRMVFANPLSRREAKK